MARERERVFSLSKFSTMANETDVEEGPTQGGLTKQEIFNRIYAANDIPRGREDYVTGAHNQDSDGDEYVEPERTSYPTN